MIIGKQARLQRHIVVDTLPLSNVISSHTPPAITAKMKSYGGQAIVTEKMTGLDQLTAKFKISGSVAQARTTLGHGYNKLIDIVVSDVGNIGDNGAEYVHTYIYAANVKSITPDTDDDGSEGAEVELSLTSYEFKSNGVTVDLVDGRTGEITLGGNTIVSPFN